jgi:hypothetical protein
MAAISEVFGLSGDGLAAISIENWPNAPQTSN